MNKLSLVGIQLPEKYKGNVDVSSESPSSGVGRELKQTTVLSTRKSDCRGGTGLKIVFVSVCGNLQHI